MHQVIPERIPMTPYYILLAISAAFLALVLADDSAIPKLPSDQLVDTALKKCQRPYDAASKKRNEILEEQARRRNVTKSKFEKRSHASGGSNAEDLTKTTVDATKDAAEVIGQVSEAIDGAKFKETTTNIMGSLRQKAMSKAFTARLRPGNLNVQRQAKALATLAKAAKGVLGAIGAVSAFLGPIAAGIGVVCSIISLFIPEPDPNEAVLNALKEGFEKINERFDVVDLKLENLELTVEKTALYTSYKMNQDRLAYVMFKYRKFSRSPNKVTLQELQETCHLYDPELSLVWIHKTVVEDRVGADLLPTILRDVKYDRDQAVDWIRIIMSDALEAVFLREVCVGVRFGEAYQKQNERTNGGRPLNLERTTLNSTELFCSLHYGREEADQMLTEITKRLDSFESELLEEFDKVQLKKDVEEMARDYSGMEACKMRTYMEQRLREKYYWSRFLVLVTHESSTLKLKSLDGHYAQVEAKVEKDKKAWFTVIAYENGYVLPPADMDDHGMDYSGFWEDKDKNGTAYLETHPKGFYDNVIDMEVPSNIQSNNGYFACVPNWDEIGGNDTFWYDPGSRSRQNLYSSDRLILSRIFIYYKTKYLANTWQCRASTSDLRKKKIYSRQDVCSATAFKRVVQSSVEHALIKNNINLHKDLASKIYNHLASSYTEFNWTVHVMAKDHLTYTSCLAESSNCVAANTSNIQILVVWSPKCDVSALVENAKSEFSAIQYVKQAIFDEKTRMNDVSSFFQDPQAYFKSKNLYNRYKNDQRIREGISKLTFAGSKIFILSTSDIETLSNGGSVSGDMKIYQKSSSGYSLSFWPVAGKYEKEGKLNVKMVFYEAYDNDECAKN